MPKTDLDYVEEAAHANHAAINIVTSQGYPRQISDHLAIMCSSMVVSMLENTKGTPEDIRDVITTAILDERERCAKLAESSHAIRGKRIAALIRGTSRGAR